MQHDDRFYFDVARPESLSRLLIFVKWLLIVPHLFVLYFFGILSGVAVFLAWFVILFTGSFPEQMWNFVYSYNRWSARVNVYTYLLRDEYPPFGDEPYPLSFHLERPQESSRLLLFGRIFMMIPLAIWAAILGLAMSFVLIYAWFSILIFGNIPEGAFNFIVGVLRYTVRVGCWASMLTDRWPGFSLENPSGAY